MGTLVHGEETEMANPKDPDRSPPSSEFLFGASREEPAAPPDRSESAEVLAELREIRERAEAQGEEIRQLRSAVERAGKEAPVEEMRSRLDALSAESKQASERMLQLPEEIEAVVRASLGARTDEDTAHRLRVAETSLAGLSETVRGLERRLSKRLEPIERAAARIEETTGAMQVTAGKLEAAAERNARMLATVEETRKAVGKLELAAGLGLGLVLAWIALLSLALEKRTQLFSEFLGLW